MIWSHYEHTKVPEPSSFPTRYLPRTQTMSGVAFWAWATAYEGPGIGRKGGRPAKQVQRWVLGGRCIKWTEYLCFKFHLRTNPQSRVCGCVLHCIPVRGCLVHRGGHTWSKWYMEWVVHGANGIQPIQGYDLILTVQLRVVRVIKKSE